MDGQLHYNIATWIHAASLSTAKLTLQMKYKARSTPRPKAFERKLSVIHASKPRKAPSVLLWAVGAVRVGALLWQRRNRGKQHKSSSSDHDTDSMETSCEVMTATAQGENPYRATIDQLLARGNELVAEVNSLPSEERQDSIADELNDIAQQIHELVEQEAAFLKGQNS
jgi:hypothetical protein